MATHHQYYRRGERGGGDGGDGGGEGGGEKRRTRKGRGPWEKALERVKGAVNRAVVGQRGGGGGGGGGRRVMMMNMKGRLKGEQEDGSGSGRGLKWGLDFG